MTADADYRKNKRYHGKEYDYEIVGELTQKGGMGTLWVAKIINRGHEREVVIKFAIKGDDYALTKLKDEAQHLEDFICRLIVGYVDQSKEGADEFFLVMERLVGADLQDKITRQGGAKKGFDEKTVIKFSRDIAKTLHYLHGCRDLRPNEKGEREVGLKHRDLNPKNIVITEQNGKYQFGEERAILIDFGIGFVGDDMTRPAGTEGWSCKHGLNTGQWADEACDIYALGRVMFYMTTGKSPTGFEIADGLRQGNLRKLISDTDGYRHVSRELSELINDMVSFGVDRATAHKIQTAGEVIERLDSLKPLAAQVQKVQVAKYTKSTPKPPPKGPHIILLGNRHEIVDGMCEIGREHLCPDFENQCDRGILHANMDKEYGSRFEFPRQPDIEIPLVGSPPRPITEAHHIRIWEDNGQWYVRDLDTVNFSGIQRDDGRWERLGEGNNRKAKTEELKGGWTLLAIGWRTGGRTGIKFSFYKK